MKLAGPIRSRRLALNSLEREAGFGAYARWMRDEEVLKYLEVRHRDRDPEDLAAYIERMNDSPDDLLLGIFLSETDQHIGNVKLGGIDRLNKRGHIGIVIGECGYWGRGYAAEAIEALSRHAFDELGLHRVWAGCHGSHAASTKAFVKAGFVEEGRVKEHWLRDGAWEDQVLLGRVGGGR